MKPAKLVASILLTVATIAATSMPASAVQLKYKPLSPTFGGTGNDAAWVDFYTYHQNRQDGGEGGGSEVTIPDFSELLSAMEELGDGFNGTLLLLTP